MRATVVVAPSLFVEHFGYTVAEALFDARPVVAARIGALPELVEHEVTGLLAAPGDGAALGAAVKRALEDPAAAQWGEAGRERVRRVGDPRAHLGELLGIYREAIDEAREGAAAKRR
jgi:glycosyltransferase involved in cell wall biosynthesis